MGDSKGPSKNNKNTIAVYVFRKSCIYVPGLSLEHFGHLLAAFGPERS